MFVSSLVWATVGLVPCVMLGFSRVTRSVPVSRLVMLFCGLAVVRSIFVVGYWHASLQPDTGEYLAGHAWWSSAVTSGCGYFLGWWGIASESVASVVVLCWVVARRVLVLPVATYPRMVLFLCFPASWFLSVASADALGAVAFAVSYRGHLSTRFQSLCVVVAVSACHLVAGLTLCCMWVVRGFRWYVSPVLVSFGCGVAACLGEGDVQIRYFLPFLIVAVCDPEPWLFRYRLRGWVAPV